MSQSFTNDTTIAFVHIPKTAGLTFRAILNASIPANQLKMDHRGILSFDELEPPCAFVTFLRNPVNRFISEYFFSAISKPNFSAYHYRLNKHITKNNLSLEAFTAEAPQLGIDNLQTRYLSMPITSHDTFPYPQVTEAHLEAARTNLEEKLSYVGITERFSESLVLLKHSWNRPLGNYVHRNRGSKKSNGQSTISDETRSLILQQNQLDMQLYEYALALFDARLAALNIDVASEVAELEQARDKHQIVYNLREDAIHVLYRLPPSVRTFIMTNLRAWRNS